MANLHINDTFQTNVPEYGGVHSCLFNPGSYVEPVSSVRVCCFHLFESEFFRSLGMWGACSVDVFVNIGSMFPGCCLCIGRMAFLFFSFLPELYLMGPSSKEKEMTWGVIARFVLKGFALLKDKLNCSHQ